jgi:hypothetical protein
MPVDETTRDTISVENLNTIASISSHSFAQSMQNSVSHAQAANAMGNACVGAIVKRLVELDVAEAAGLSPLVEILGKIANTTPPEFEPE